MWVLLLIEARFNHAGGGTPRIVYASRVPPRPIRGTKLGGYDLSIFDFLADKSGASRQRASALVKPCAKMHSKIVDHFN